MPSGPVRWHQGEMSSIVNGMGPRGVEIITIDLGSAASAVSAELSAEFLQGGLAPSIRTTLVGSLVDKSHHDPGILHLVANSA